LKKRLFLLSLLTVTSMAYSQNLETKQNNNLERQVNTPDFHKIIGLVAGVQEEPDLLHEMINTRLFTRTSNIYHPFMCGLIVLLTFIRSNIPEKENISSLKIKLKK